jgi:recombination protein RecA
VQSTAGQSATAKTSTAKSTTAKSTTAKELIARHKKNYGNAAVSEGGHQHSVVRIPTGLFPFDLASGGGFPRGRASIVYGPESSSKTNMALKAIASHQALWPDQVNIFVAIEGFDPLWARRLGVDTDRLIVLYPSYAEQAVDMIEEYLHAEDCGLVVLDSLAAMVTTQEAEKSAEGAIVGGASVAVGKLIRKSTLAFTEAEKAGRSPTLLYVNQTRFKIGVMFGNPETMPGGNAPKFQSALTVRVYGKNLTDTKVSQVMPVMKETTFTIPKWKVPIVAASGVFKMVTYPHAGFVVGEVDDWNTVSQYLRAAGQLEKLGAKGWTMLGETHPTLQACRDRLHDDKAFGLEVRRAIIERVLNDGMAALQETV